MSSRSGWLITVLSACTILAACAEGAPAAAPDEITADPLLAVPPSVCGNGMKEPGESCDCPESATTMCAAPEESCEKLGMGTGSVYCDANTCMLITQLCTTGQGATAGTSGGAAGAGR